MDQRSWMLVVGGLVVGLVLGYILKGGVTQTQPIPTPPPEANLNRPSSGFDLHIDAEKHFPAEASKIAHHYCKQVGGGITECQLYDSDSPDAKLVGVETVVPTDTWKGFGAEEQALWHYHKEEIPKVNAKLPDLSDEEAAKVAKSLEETYGKIYLLWDPSAQNLPVGNPSLNILP